MDIDTAKEKLQAMLLWNLISESPVLSGNMKSFIHIGEDYSVVIEAPFYDEKAWRKDHVIVHTGETKNGYTDYALLVNELGAFGRHNKSEHWVNRVINMCVSQIAQQLGGVVEKYLPE